MMATRVVYCSGCKGAIVVDEQITFRPRECPYCRIGSWDSPQAPAKPLWITKEDWAFLKTNRIAEPEPEPDDCA